MKKGDILNQVEDCIDGDNFDFLYDFTREVEFPLSDDELGFERWKTRLFIECFSPYMLLGDSILEIGYDSISDDVVKMEFSLDGSIESVGRVSLDEFIESERHLMSARIPDLYVYEWWLESKSNEG